MSEASRSAGTGCRAAVAVDAQLQSFGVYVVRQRLDATGESFGVCLDESVGIALSVPAVVEINIGVAGIAHASLHEGVGNSTHEFLVDIAGKLVPGVPSHLRTVTNLFPFLRHQTLTGYAAEEDT